MWNNQKQQNMFSVLSNLQTYYHFQLDLQKVDQHTGGKWLMHRTKRHKENLMMFVWVKKYWHVLQLAQD